MSEEIKSDKDLERLAGLIPEELTSVGIMTVLDSRMEKGATDEEMMVLINWMRRSWFNAKMLKLILVGAVKADVVGDDIRFTTVAEKEIDQRGKGLAQMVWEQHKTKISDLY